MAKQHSRRKLRWHKELLPPLSVSVALILILLVGAVGYAQSVKLQTLNRINNEQINTWRHIASHTDQLLSKYQSADRIIQRDLQESIAERAAVAIDQEVHFQDALNDIHLLKLLRWVFPDKLATLRSSAVDRAIWDKVSDIIQSSLDEFSSGYAGWSAGDVVDFRNGELVAPLLDRQQMLATLHISHQKRLFILLTLIVLTALAAIFRGVTKVLLPTLSALEVERDYATDDARMLEMSNRRLTLLVERASDTLFFTDPEGLVTRINPAAEKLTGFQAKDAKGQSINNVCLLIDPVTRKPLRNLFLNRKSFQNPDAGIPSILQDMQGTEHPVMVQCSAVQNELKQDQELIWTVKSVPASECFDSDESRHVA